MKVMQHYCSCRAHVRVRDLHRKYIERWVSTNGKLPDEDSVYLLLMKWYSTYMWALFTFSQINFMLVVPEALSGRCCLDKQ